MITKDTTATIERSIITALIISSDFTNRIAPFMKIRFFQSTMSQIVAGWCKEYYADYKKAPGKQIETIYRMEMENLSDDMSELIAKFLTSISKEYEEKVFDWEHIFDRASEYFEKRNLEITAQEIKHHLENDSIQDACKILEQSKSYRASIEFESKTAFDEEKNKALFALENTEPLFKLSGRLGELLNEYFVPEGFMAFFGKEKIGKSQVMDGIALAAARARNNVLLLDCGDNSEIQRRGRLSIKLTNTPLLSKYCGTFHIPILDCHKNQMKECRLEHRAGGKDAPGLFSVDSKGNKIKLTPEEAAFDYTPCDTCRRMKNYSEFIPETYWEEIYIEEPLSCDKALEAWGKLRKVMKGRDFKIDCHPTRSLTISKLRSNLHYWKQSEGFIPNVIVVDFADIMLAENQRLQSRDQIDSIWAGLRGVAQDHKCLIVTCSHVGREFLSKDITEQAPREDIRKLAHVTCAVAMNQNDSEKADGILRMNIMMAREGEWNSAHQVRILQSLRIGKVFGSSY